MNLLKEILSSKNEKNNIGIFSFNDPILIYNNFTANYIKKYNNKILKKSRIKKNVLYNICYYY